MCRRRGLWSLGPGSAGFQVAVLVPLQLIPTFGTFRHLARLRGLVMRVANYASVCCDWLAGFHEYPSEVTARDSGRILRLDADGVVEWESQSWEQIKCSSSDTSLRVKCDGRYLRFTGNIGRFQEKDNELGLTVIQCVEKWEAVLRRLGFDTAGFGQVLRRRVADGYGECLPERPEGQSVLDCGTTLTRVDLAGNFDVSDYAGLCFALLIRRIEQRLPLAGRYGPTWGYEAKRSNWWKAKLYDKTAEMNGKRRSDGGATRARFEVQLGAEYLKREGLDRVKGWIDMDTAQIIYGRFADQVFKDGITVQEWASLPPRLEHWATLWREGRDLRAKMSKTTYYRTAAKLREYGIDIGTPCNLLALTRHIQVVEVRPVSALRDAA